MSSSDQLTYKLSFEQAKGQILQVFLDWFDGPRESPPDLSGFEDVIYVKNRSRVMTLVSDGYVNFFGDGMTPVGRSADSFLAESIKRVSQHTDALILDGIDHLELDHVGAGSNSDTYEIRTYKCSLVEYGFEAYAILGISRPLKIIRRAGESGDKPLELKEQHKIYLGLDQIDKSICEKYAQGESTKDIANAVGLTTKSVENHRKKIMEQLGLSRPIEIVKLMVRFQDRDWI